MARSFTSLILLIAVLLSVGCATQLDHRLSTLQNPAYAGNAHRDLVPYQARTRDQSTCMWGIFKPETFAALMQIDDADTDVAIESLMRRCMASKGWD
jgi:hypothetical protein